MIIACKSCARKFIVKDSDIPEGGRVVQCGYCSVTWHQMPRSLPTTIVKPKNIKKPATKTSKDPPVGGVKASDGKTYKFLGRQWVQLFPSGKTGLFAKKKIGRELNKLTGRKLENIAEERKKEIKKELDPFAESLDSEKKLPDIYKPKKGLGFFGIIFLLIIIGIFTVGILKTFENDLINYFPEIQYIFELLDKKLVYVFEAVKNMITIIEDLINSY